MQPQHTNKARVAIARMRPSVWAEAWQEFALEAADKLPPVPQPTSPPRTSVDENGRNYHRSVVNVDRSTRPRTRRRKSAPRKSLIARILLVALVVTAAGGGVLGFVAYTSAQSVQAQIVAEFSAGQAQMETGKT